MENKAMQPVQRVYVSPKLWYLRVLIIEAQHIMPGHTGSEVVRHPKFSTKVQVGNRIWRTKNAIPSTTRNFSNPYWDMEHLFVLTEPFQDYVLISVEDEVEARQKEVVATMHLPMAKIEKRTNEKLVTSRWFDLDSHFGGAGYNDKLNTRFVSQIHMQISLDDGYDVLDEGTMHISDVSITNKRLWNPYVGVLEIRILRASGLTPMKIKDGRGVTDAYCVAKYGPKWVRTHTVVDSLSPTWNEQYMWEVYDPCSVLTIAVFDDCLIKNAIARDSPIGKVRIRLSTIETDTLHTHSYPLLKLNPAGLRKMGELHLALRFSCTNVAKMLLKYTMPLLPKMRYVHPLSGDQLRMLKAEALAVVESKLRTEEPPLRRGVVDYMHDWHMWSLRRSKANLNRLTSLYSSLNNMLKWLDAICNWKNRVYSALFLIIFLTLVMLPKLIPSIILLCMAFVALWNYRYGPGHAPPHMDVRLSHAEQANPDELAEEFDTFPTTARSDVVRMRYDRLRSIAGRIQRIMGNVATYGELFQALPTWRDPRATFLFMMLCLVAAVGFCVVPIRVVVALLGLYSLRPPLLIRSKLPSLVLCFLKRLPSKDDNMLFVHGGRDYERNTQGLLVVSILESLTQPT